MTDLYALLYNGNILLVPAYTDNLYISLLMISKNSINTQQLPLYTDFTVLLISVKYSRYQGVDFFYIRK
jgi:hypothetical protein